VLVQTRNLPESRDEESQRVVVVLVKGEPGRDVLVLFNHSVTKAVSPKPAGAEMSVSLRCNPAFNRSIRRGRGIWLRRGGEM